VPPAGALRALLGSVVAAAAAALVLVAAPGAGAAGWAPHVRAAIAYAHTRQGEVRFAVRTDDHLWGYKRTEGVHSASVIKALLLVAYLDDPRVRARRLTAADHRLIDPMIRRSDNTAATRVLGYVGARRVRATANRVGMHRFRLNPTLWGASRIDASDQTRFFLHYEAHVVARHRATALHLLATITREQRWGIGQVRPAGWNLYFKGGWGSGTGLVDHQVALLTRGTDRVSVAVLTTGSPSHEYGKRTLRGVFVRLLRGLGVQLVLTPL
jgi:hypothetical protein